MRGVEAVELQGSSGGFSTSVSHGHRFFCSVFLVDLFFSILVQCLERIKY